MTPRTPKTMSCQKVKNPPSAILFDRQSSFVKNPSLPPFRGGKERRGVFDKPGAPLAPNFSGRGF